MLVTLDGIVILVSPVQPWNASLPMLVTASPDGDVEGITISASVHVPIPVTEQVPSPLDVNASPSEEATDL